MIEKTLILEKLKACKQGLEEMEVIDDFDSFYYDGQNELINHLILWLEEVCLL